MKFFDYIFLIRPTLLIPGWTFFLLGYYRAKCYNPKEFVGKINQPLTLAFISVTFLMSGMYVLNQIADIDSDRINKKLYLLPQGIISIKHAYIECILLFIFSFILSIKFNVQFKLLLFISFILGMLYSLQPFKLKARPIIDMLSNAVGYGIIAFSLGWSLRSNISSKPILYSLPYFFAVAGVFVNTTIPDIEGDKKTNEITTGVLLKEKSYYLSTLLILLSYIFSLLLNDIICLVASTIALPLFLLAAIKKDLKNCFISIRVSSPILVILTCMKFTWLLLLLVFLVITMRIYYKYRFNVVYPKIV